MATPRRKLWDQMPDEPGEDYADFLFFRNCGQNRTLRGAYQRFVREHVLPGNGIVNPNPEVSKRWTRLCEERNWRQRASAWDIHGLRTVGARLIVHQSRTLLRMSRKAMNAAKHVTISHDGPAEIMEVVKAVQAYLTPEVVGANAVTDAAEETAKDLEPAGSVE